MSLTVQPARLSKRPGSVWNCLWGHALKISPGINRKSRVLYPGSGFISSDTWPSLPKKHYKQSTKQPDCLKGQKVFVAVNGDMRLKDLLGSIARVGYCNLAPGFLSSAI